MQTTQQGEVQNFRLKIGLYCDIGGALNENIVSTYKESFTDSDEVDYFDIHNGYCSVKLNSIKNLACEMRESLANMSRFDSYIDCIMRAVLSHKYNGKLDKLKTYDIRAKVEDKEKAYCKNSKRYIEVAMAAHNCLRHCEKDSIFKISKVKIRFSDETEIEFIHAYNLVAENGKYYIVDFSLPKANVLKGRFDCVVCEISRRAYMDMKKSKGDTYGIRVVHPEVLTIPKYEVIYDSDKPKILNSKREVQKDTKSKVQKKVRNERIS